MKPSKPSYQTKPESKRANIDTPLRGEDTAAPELLEGRNAVLEALRSGRTIDKVYLAAGTTDPALNRIASLAKEAGAVVAATDRRKLDQLSVTGAHQGVIAAVAAHNYAEVQDILDLAQSRGEAPLIIVCDELSDPHNLGAIIRTAECAGAHGIIIPKRRSVGLTGAVAKAAAGAVEYLPVARVANLASTLEDLKRQGIWVFGTAADGEQSMYQTDLTVPAALVIGSEGDGMSRLIRERCDLRLRIPMQGHIDSLNASVAAALLIYEAVRQRLAAGRN